MQGSIIRNASFLLFALYTFIMVGCAKAPSMVEQPTQVTTKPVEQSTQPQLPVKRGALVIISEPIGADVKIDDIPMGMTPLALKDVPVGSYRIEIGLMNYETWFGETDVKHEQTADVRAKLESRLGSLEIKSGLDDKKVQVDGKDAVTYNKFLPSNIEYSITVSAEGYYPASQNITLKPDGKETLSILLKKIPTEMPEVKAEPNEEKQDVSNALEKQITQPDSIIGKDGIKMKLIPAGEFMMGSPEGEGYDNEHPQHVVFLDAFYIDIYEVTNAQYKQFMDETGYKAPKYWDDPNFNAPNQPVVGVSWNDAKAYAGWAGERLPTEAEWEKAAKGNLIGKDYPWGDTLTHDDANYDGTGGKDQWDGPAPVGSFTPNGYGLFDMAGNVWEWCADWYDKDYYSKSPKSNPTGPSSGSTRAIRSGSWDDNAADDLRVSCRISDDSDNADIYVGFRCVSGFQ